MSCVWPVSGTDVIAATRHRARQETERVDRRRPIIRLERRAQDWLALKIIHALTLTPTAPIRALAFVLSDPCPEGQGSQAQLHTIKLRTSRLRTSSLTTLDSLYILT